MFTGIIESVGRLTNLESSGSNIILTIESDISKDLKPDQSVAHNGICLTIEQQTPTSHRVTAIAETLVKTNLKYCKPGDSINLERSMVANQRIDGHFVQGHVDATGVCEDIKDINGSWEIGISYDYGFDELVIEKGSICMNGISLTIFNVTPGRFTVGIIPYTFEHTNMKTLKEGDYVNLEFDVIGKYITKMARNYLK